MSASSVDKFLVVTCFEPHDLKVAGKDSFCQKPLCLCHLSTKTLIQSFFSKEQMHWLNRIIKKLYVVVRRKKTENASEKGSWQIEASYWKFMRKRKSITLIGMLSKCLSGRLWADIIVFIHYS